MSGGQRKGTGPKRKHAVPQSHRTVSIRLSTHVYDRWCECKVRMNLKTNDDTADYFLNLAEAFDEQLPRYKCYIYVFLLYCIYICMYNACVYVCACAGAYVPV